MATVAASKVQAALGEELSLNRFGHLFGHKSECRFLHFYCFLLG